MQQMFYVLSFNKYTSSEIASDETFLKNAHNAQSMYISLEMHVIKTTYSTSAPRFSWSKHFLARLSLQIAPILKSCS